MNTASEASHRLDHFPAALFASVMGMAGLAIAWIKAGHLGLAPGEIGSFLSYVALTDSLDAFARILYFSALFLGLLLASNALRFFRVPFFISTWAYSFPLAAMTLATFEMGSRSGLALYTWLGWALLVLLTGVVAILAVKTLMAALKGRICVPE